MMLHRPFHRWISRVSAGFFHARFTDQRWLDKSVPIFGTHVVGWIGNFFAQRGTPAAALHKFVHSFNILGCWQPSAAASP